MVERLQAKASSIGRILTSLEKKYNSTHGDESSDMKKSPSGHLFSHQPPNKRAHLRIQQIPPFNANKIRKSPSTDPSKPIDEEKQTEPVKTEKVEEEDEKEKNEE